MFRILLLLIIRFIMIWMRLNQSWIFFNELQQFKRCSRTIVKFISFFDIHIIYMIYKPCFLTMPKQLLDYSYVIHYQIKLIILKSELIDKIISNKKKLKKYLKQEQQNEENSKQFKLFCYLDINIQNWAYICKFIQQYQQKKMDIEPKSLIVKGKSTNIGKLYTRSKIKKQGTVIQVQLYQKGIVQLGASESLCKTIQFDFDLKFSFTKQSWQIKFERGKDTCLYTLLSEQDLAMWRQFLKTKINQRGFHQQFKPIKKIGKGNFASVYLAQKLEDGVHYAIKAFSKQAAYSQQNGKQCLIKQIQVMRCLNHKNTMKLYEVFQSQNSLYIIFELLAGGQLYDKVKSKYKFKHQQTRTIIHGILKGLRQMHTKGIMHRDLKPQNLLFRKQGQWDCVIADFGLAQFSSIDSYLFVRCGTPGYVAPQVINIKDMKTKYSPICDIYSLGLIFHILLFGKSAFPGTTYNQVLAQNRAANIDLAGEQYKKVGQEALDLLSLMLRKKPNQRITAEQALNHQYFRGMEMEQEMHEESGHEKIENNSNSTANSSYPNCDSPLLTSANPKRKLDKSLKKDSCVEFHMGKQNVLTGKTEQVQSLKSNKISIANAASPIRKPKVSQFSAQFKQNR